MEDQGETPIISERSAQLAMRDFSVRQWKPYLTYVTRKICKASPTFQPMESWPFTMIVQWIELYMNARRFTTTERAAILDLSLDLQEPVLAAWCSKMFKSDADVYVSTMQGTPSVYTYFELVHLIPNLQDRFDVIVLSEALQHIATPAPDQFLRSLKARLRPEGRIFLSLPDAANYGRTYQHKEKWQDTIIGAQPFYTAGIAANVWFFTESELKEVIHKAGLEIVSYGFAMSDSGVHFNVEVKAAQ